MWDTFTELPTRSCVGESCKGWLAPLECNCLESWFGEYYLDCAWYDKDELVFPEGTHTMDVIWDWFEKTYDIELANP